MIRCCNCCVPTCQHCIYAELEKVEVNGWIYTGEIERCTLHPDKEVDGAYYCKDFHCFKAKDKRKSNL